MEPAVASGVRRLFPQERDREQRDPDPAGDNPNALDQAEWRVLNGAIPVHGAEPLADDERRDHDDTCEQGSAQPRHAGLPAKRLDMTMVAMGSKMKTNRPARAWAAPAPRWVGRVSQPWRIAQAWIGDKETGDDQRQAKETQQHGSPDRPFTPVKAPGVAQWQSRGSEVHRR